MSKGPAIMISWYTMKVKADSPLNIIVSKRDKSFSVKLLFSSPPNGASN